MSIYYLVYINRTVTITPFYMACKKGQFKVVELRVNKFSNPKNRARGNRKTLKRPKTMSKINFRNLKMKSHEEYLICTTYFVMYKT